MKIRTFFVLVLLMALLSVSYVATKASMVPQDTSQIVSCPSGWYVCGTSDAPLCCQGSGCPSFVCGDAKTSCQSKYPDLDITAGWWAPWVRDNGACLSILMCSTGKDEFSPWTLCNGCCAACSLPSVP